MTVMFVLWTLRAALPFDIRSSVEQKHALEARYLDCNVEVEHKLIDNSYHAARSNAKTDHVPSNLNRQDRNTK